MPPLVKPLRSLPNHPAGFHPRIKAMNTIQEEFPAGDASLPPALLARAYNDLRARAIELERALLKVAKLNPDAGEIGAGMLKQIVTAAREALNQD